MRTAGAPRATPQPITSSRGDSPAPRGLRVIHGGTARPPRHPTVRAAYTWTTGSGVEAGSGACPEGSRLRFHHSDPALPRAEQPAWKSSAARTTVRLLRRIAEGSPASGLDRLRGLRRAPRRRLGGRCSGGRRLLCRGLLGGCYRLLCPRRFGLGGRLLRHLRLPCSGLFLFHGARSSAASGGWSSEAHGIAP